MGKSRRLGEMSMRSTAVLLMSPIQTESAYDTLWFGRTHEIERFCRGRKIGGDGRLPAPDRRLPEAPLPAHHPADAVQLSRRYPRQVARHQVSLHSTLPLRFPGEARRRV